VVIEGDEERLFRCEDPQCGVISCRKCKKPVSGFVFLHVNDSIFWY
jgi:hypothetical protein